MSYMQEFIDKYRGHVIEDAGMYVSDDFKNFARGFKKALEKDLPNARITGFKIGHYDLTGFIKQGGASVYIDYSYTRHLPFDPDRGGAAAGILYRTAKDENDYHGGVNNFCTFPELCEAVTRMLDRENARIGNTPAKEAPKQGVSVPPALAVFPSRVRDNMSDKAREAYASLSAEERREIVDATRFLDAVEDMAQIAEETGANVTASQIEDVAYEYVYGDNGIPFQNLIHDFLSREASRGAGRDL